MPIIKPLKRTVFKPSKPAPKTKPVMASSLMEGATTKPIKKPNQLLPAMPNWTAKPTKPIKKGADMPRKKSADSMDTLDIDMMMEATPVPPKKKKGDMKKELVMFNTRKGMGMMKGDMCKCGSGMSKAECPCMKKRATRGHGGKKAPNMGIGDTLMRDKPDMTIMPMPKGGRGKMKKAQGAVVGGKKLNPMAKAINPRPTPPSMPNSALMNINPPRKPSRSMTPSSSMMKGQGAYINGKPAHKSIRQKTK